LSYRFGFSAGGRKTFWTAYRSSSFVDVSFPSGSIQIFAQVQDSLGQSTNEIDVTKVALLTIGKRESSRRLLAGDGISWPTAFNQVKDLAAKSNAKDMNSKIGSMAIQNSIEYTGNILNLSTSKQQTYMLLEFAAQALSFSEKISDNVCESFGVVQKLTSNPLNLDLWSAINASNIVKTGVTVDDQSDLKTLDSTCTSNAFLAFNDIRDALNNISNGGGSMSEVKYFLETERNATASLVKLYSSVLTTASPPLDLNFTSTFHHIARMDTQKLGGEIRFASEGMANASFSLPAQLLSSNLNITSDGLNVHARASSYAPVSSGLLIRSPVVGLTLSQPNGESCKVQGLLQAINISIPFHKMSDAEWDSFRQQVECMFWDYEKMNYSTDGVKVSRVTRTAVVCQSSHLTDFVLNQNSSIKLASTIVDNVSPTTKSSTEWVFEDMLRVVGNRSAAKAMAMKMPWVPASISISQSKQALGLALSAAGGFGVPCTESVPFLALPGLVLSTVKGTVYPKDYALSLKTIRDLERNQTVSAMTTFTAVEGTRNRSVKVELTGFPISQNRRSSSCAAGTEWRYKSFDGAGYSICSCAANTDCKGETVCVGTPLGGDVWAVEVVYTDFCAIPLVPSTDNSGEKSRALGLGLGLGLGLPLTACLGFLVHKNSAAMKGKTNADSQGATADTSGFQESAGASASASVVTVADSTNQPGPGNV
jgi:hypothetical protein